jgi:hypothetical protein
MEGLPHSNTAPSIVAPALSSACPAFPSIHRTLKASYEIIAKDTACKLFATQLRCGPAACSSNLLSKHIRFIWSTRGSWRALRTAGEGADTPLAVMADDPSTTKRAYRANTSYGARCRFSHDRTRDGGRNHDSHANDEPETLEQAGARTAYFDYRRLLRFTHILGGSNLSPLVQLCADAANVLDGGGRDWHQMVVRDLVDETSFGRQYTIPRLPSMY